VGFETFALKIVILSEPSESKDLRFLIPDRLVTRKPPAFQLTGS